MGVRSLGRGHFNRGRVALAVLFHLVEAGADVGGNRTARHLNGMMTRHEAIDLFRSDDLIGIGMAADAVRRKLHPDGIVSYIIDRNINYTNFCTEYCSFCAFYRPMGHAEGYLHPKQVIFDKIQETIDLGGTGILMQGGLHPDLKIEWYEDLLRSIKQRFRPIWCHCFSAPEIVNIAEVSGLDACMTPSRGCATRVSIRSPAAAPRFWTTTCANASARLKSLGPGLDRRASHRARAGHADHGDHDVRLRRNHRAAHESFRHRAPDPGRDRRVHGLHPVGVPAREHFARPLRQGRSDRG